MVREIIMYGDPVLRTKCDPVEEVTDEIRALADDMLETMVDADGIGLAAPQVGEPIQLAVIDVSLAEDCVSYLRIDGKEKSVKDCMPLVFINPQLEFGDTKENQEEGCLSFPDVRGEVRRPYEVVARMQLLDGSTIRVETDGLLARVIQHETDHLFGVLFIDRMSAAQKLGLKKKIREMQQDYVR